MTKTISIVLRHALRRGGAGFAILTTCSVGATAEVHHSYGPATFDIDARRAVLQRPEYSAAREACLAGAVEDLPAIPDPLPALGATEAYGSDQSAEDYSWPVMVLAGRSLAGADDATLTLIDALASWAEGGALEQTATDYDPFYAMKRMLLPTMVAFRIVADDMTAQQRDTVRTWIDGLVRRVDTTFDGDVDYNNHRYLADLVLMTWGSITRDDVLLAKGAARFSIAMEQARPDGSLPLEARRGARAMWYTNMAVGELMLMLRVAQLNGIELPAEQDGNLDSILGYLADALTTPALILAYAAENYIPGPTSDYRAQDAGFTETRGHGRHYMAWIESLALPEPSGPAAARIRTYATTHLAGLRPLIDEYAGGNATCFWWEPESW